MSSKVKAYIAAAAVVGLCLGATAPAAVAQSSSPNLSAFAGHWKFDPQKSRLFRAGPGGSQVKRDPNFTWVFTPEGKNLRMDVYAAYPQPEPTRTMTVNVDGKYHGCTSHGSCLTSPGDPKSQSYAYWQTDPRMLVRIFKEGGKISEYSTYAVSADGKTFAAVSWSPETPEYTNLQVFDRQP